MKELNPELEKELFSIVKRLEHFRANKPKSLGYTIEPEAIIDEDEKAYYFEIHISNDEENEYMINKRVRYSKKLLSLALINNTINKAFNCNNIRTK